MHWFRSFKLINIVHLEREKPLEMRELFAELV